MFHRRLVSSWVRVACSALVIVVSLGSVEAAAPPRRPVAPPKVLNIVRQTLKPGTVPAYEELEEAIARGYRRARIPIYWVCLQASANPTAILYLNVYDAKADADRATATHTNMVPRHRDLVRMQARLAKYGASPPVSMLSTRREEFEYGRRDVDFATMGALRVTVFHVRAGREGEFLEAARSGRAVPWQIYEDSGTSTFFLVAPLRSTRERDPGIPRALRGLRGVYRADRPVTYAVQPAMSHASPEYVTANPRLRMRP